MIIIAPRLEGRYPEREIDCQMAIEDALLKILGDANTLGWTKAEVLTAMIAVADNTALALDSTVAESVRIHMSKLMKKPDV